MTGKQPYQSIPEFIASSDICILPSFNNNIMNDIVPIKTYEYMSMSKPVIATKLPGVMREFGENNGVFYVDNPKEVFYKALELIKNDELEYYGKKAREFTLKNDWNDVVHHFESISKDVIEWRKSKIQNHEKFQAKLTVNSLKKT